MNKKLITIIALIVAILIIAVVGILVGGNDNSGSAGKNGEVVEGIFNEETAEDAEISGGIEDSIFDDVSNNSDGGTNNTANGSNDKNTSNNKENGSQNDNGSSVKPGEKIDYETFHAMSPEAQRKYMESFKDIDKFFRWYNKAKAKYEKDHPAIEIDGGPVKLQ